MSNDSKKPGKQWQAKTPKNVLPKSFIEPTDRPFASLESMSASDFEQAFNAENQDNQA